MLAINLLPVREVRKRAEARQMVMQLVLVLLLTAAGLGAFDARTRSEIHRSQGRIQQMEKDIAQFKPQLDKVEGFKKKKSELEKKIEVIDGLDRARRGPVRVMAELSDNIPDRVWLTSLDATGNVLKLQGESLDNELVALFLRDLGESDYFSGVDLESTKLGADKGGLKTVKFDMKATIATAAEPAAAAGPAKKGAKAGKSAKAPKGPTASTSTPRNEG